MNANPAMAHEDAKVVELSESPGRRLRVQRQSRGLEIERIAAQLHLRPAVVEALEQDRYADLPGPVFVTGYLRNYARLLDLDPDPLLAAYRSSLPILHDAPAAIPVAPDREIGSGRLLVRLIGLAVLATVAGMVALWWNGRDDSLASRVPELAEPPAAVAPLREPPPPADTAPPTALSLPTLPATVAPPPRLETAPGVAQAPMAQDPATPIGDGPPPSAAAAAPPRLEPDNAIVNTPPPPTVEPPRPQVAMVFSRATWIEVVDASGKVLLKGNVGKGERRVLDGVPPFSVALRHLKAAAIEIDGKPYQARANTRGGLARFKLDPDSSR